MGLGLANNSQLAELLALALDEVAPKDGLPIWDSRLGGVGLIDPGPFPEGRKLGRSRPLGITGLGPSQVMPWHHGQTRLAGEMVGTIAGTVPYLQRHTVEYALPTRITQLATNTTLGTATRHDTASTTINIPETAERVFESARLVVTYRSEWIATNSAIGWLLGLKIGTGSTIDVSKSPAALNTASRNVVDEVDIDVTEQFNRDFTGTSQALVGSFAYASTVAANVNQITFKLYITYAFDPNVATTRLRTIRIPLQSMAGSLTTAQQEFGTDGVNPVATNQIPALDTYLAEQSKVYRQITAEFWGHDGNSAGTTAFTPFIQLDATAETTRATIDVTVNTYQQWRDSLDLTGLDTSVAHKLSARASLTNRMPMICAFVIVTYEYDHAATVTANLATYEALVPLTNSISSVIGPHTTAAAEPSGQVAGATTGTNRLAGTFSIQEPGTPTLLQSGVFAVFDVGGGGGGAAVGFKFPWQTAARVYTQITTSGGPTPLISRLDGYSLSRGDNKIAVDISGIRAVRFAYAIVNYTAGVRIDVDNGNQPINYLCHSYDSVIGSATFTTGITREAQGVHVPNLGSAYKIVSALIVAQMRVSSSSIADGFLIEERDGELDANLAESTANIGSSSSVVQSNLVVYSFTRLVNRDSLSRGKIDVTLARRMIPQNNYVWPGFASWSWWITYHQHQFTVAGSIVIDGAAAPAGKSVKIFAYAAAPANQVYPEGMTAASDAAELVTTVTTDASGNFTASVPGNTRSYFASYDNDGRAGRSLLGTPV